MQIIVHTLDGRTVVGDPGLSMNPVNQVTSVLDTLMANGPVGVYCGNFIVAVPSSNVSRIEVEMTDDEMRVYKATMAAREAGISEETLRGADVLEGTLQGTVGTDERDGSADA